MKPKDITDIKYVEYSEETNNKSPKFKVGDNVRISKYKIFLLKVIHLIGLKTFLLLIKYRILFLGLI